jgi:hypothetical protein
LESRFAVGARPVTFVNKKDAVYDRYPRLTSLATEGVDVVPRGRIILILPGDLPGHD